MFTDRQRQAKVDRGRQIQTKTDKYRPRQTIEDVVIEVRHVYG